MNQTQQVANELPRRADSVIDRGHVAVSRFRTEASFGAGLFLLVLGGCGQGPLLAPVSGRVTLDGKPLASGEVKFEPEVGRASHGRTGENGQYELRYTRDEMGALVGSHTVRLLSATEVTLPNGKFVLKPQRVPPRYNTQSELRREVKADGENQFDFELTTKAK